MIIKGNTVGTTSPRPNWNQTDPRKADYIENKPQSLKTVYEATINAGAINLIEVNEQTFKSLLKEGINHISLVLSDGVIFKGESWYLTYYYQSLYYFNGTKWEDIQQKSGIGYSKGQTMDIELKVENGVPKYVHILNLPSAIPFTEEYKAEVVEAVIEALPKAEGMTV